MNMKRSSKSSKWLIGVFLLIISVILAFILAMLIKSTTKVRTVLVTVNEVKAGSVITKDDIIPMEVGEYNSPKNLVSEPSQVIGRYAIRDIPANEYIFSSSITNDYMKRLSEKAKYGAMAIPINTLDSVTADIKENDFVTILVSMKKNKDQEIQGESTDQLPEVSTALIYTKELAAVRVLGLYTSDGKKYEKGVTEGSPSMIVFDALPVQRVLLNQAIDNGKVRITILPEYVQNGFRKAWGLLDEKDNEKVDSDKVEDIIESNLEKNQELEEKHMNMSEKDTIGNLVDKENDDVIEGTKEDIIEKKSEDNKKEHKSDEEKSDKDKTDKEKEDEDFFSFDEEEENNN